MIAMLTDEVFDEHRSDCCNGELNSKFAHTLLGDNSILVIHVSVKKVVFTFPRYSTQCVFL